MNPMDSKLVRGNFVGTAVFVAAAALATRQSTTPSAVPLKDLRAVLARHGAIVPD